MRRLIYAVMFDLECDQPGASRQLVAPLDPAGQSKHCRAVPPKQRVIDLRVGDWVRHGGKVHRIVAVRAFREAMVRDDWQGSEGYLVRTGQGR